MDGALARMWGMRNTYQILVDKPERNPRHRRTLCHLKYCGQRESAFMRLVGRNVENRTMLRRNSVVSTNNILAMKPEERPLACCRIGAESEGNNEPGPFVRLKYLQNAVCILLVLTVDCYRSVLTVCDVWVGLCNALCGMMCVCFNVPDNAMWWSRPYVEPQRPEPKSHRTCSNKRWMARHCVTSIASGTRTEVLRKLHKYIVTWCVLWWGTLMCVDHCQCTDLKKPRISKCTDWIKLAVDMDQWRTLVDMAINLRAP
jgi:hypothetical protein